MYNNLPKRFVHEGIGEVLDEGVEGSLTTHLQVVCKPAAKGEQSLTFKETPEKYSCQMHTLKISTKLRADSSTNTTDVWNKPKGLKLKHQGTILSLD